MGFYFNTNSITPSGGGGSGGDAVWGGITGTLSNQTDLQTALNAKVNSTDLSTVATSGSYADLSNKPTIPTTTDSVTQSSTAALTSGGAYTALNGKQDTLTAGTGIDITNNTISVDSETATEVTLATVATTGAYSDLTGTPNLSGYQVTSNLVTSLSNVSTDVQYPSAKCVYDLVGDVETLISAL